MSHSRGEIFRRRGRGAWLLSNRWRAYGLAVITAAIAYLALRYGGIVVSPALVIALIVMIPWLVIVETSGREVRRRVAFRFTAIRRPFRWEWQRSSGTPRPGRPG
jgi:hypothetical protein